MKHIKNTLRFIRFTAGAILLGYFVLISAHIIVDLGSGALQAIGLTGIAFAIGSAIILTDREARR